jgi:cytochrome P450
MALEMPEWLGLAFFYIALTLYVANEFYYFIPKSPLDRIKAFFNKLGSTAHDYRSGKYYKPWKSSKQTVVVSSKKQIMELSEEAVLSQRAVYADMFGFKHTMNNLDHHDHRIARSRLYGRLLQVSGPTHLAKLYPYIQGRLVKSLEHELEQGKSTSRSISVPIAQTVRTVASRMMGLIFFGENISSDPEFAQASLRYPADMVKCMTAFQVTPSFLSPIVHSYLTNRGRAMHLIQDRLVKVMGPNRKNWNESSDVEKLTIIHNMSEMTEGNDYWTPEVLSQSLLGIWFAASHQPWMNLDFMLLELCARPEWQSILRNEIGDYGAQNYESLEKLPLLDSFMKETVRMNPLDTLAIRRKALANFTFSDGNVHVPAGSTACVSSYDLMHDELTYPNPDEFDGRRFVTTKSSARGTKLTEVSEKFPIWGYGSLACPGRFHASLIMKMILAHLVSSFDLSFDGEKARRKWSWETFTMPYESTRIVLTKREL